MGKKLLELSILGKFTHCIGNNLHVWSRLSLEAGQLLRSRVSRISWKKPVETGWISIISLYHD